MTNFLQRIKNFFKPLKDNIGEKHPLDGPIRAAEEKMLKPAPAVETKPPAPVVQQPIEEPSIQIKNIVEEVKSNDSKVTPVKKKAVVKPRKPRTKK